MILLKLGPVRGLTLVMSSKLTLVASFVLVLGLQLELAGVRQLDKL